MNFLNKKTRNKIIAQALVGASVFGMGTGYNFAFTPPMQVNALTDSRVINSITYNFDTVTKTASVYDTTKTGAVSIPSSVLIDGVKYSVTTLGVYAFNGKSTITSVTLPDTITTIENYAFNSCSGLKSVNIPSGITSITPQLFNYCISLTSITIPSSVTSIGEQAFCSCKSLTSITIPDSVTSIGNSAFSGCEKLTSVTLNSGLKTIGTRAFDWCTHLNAITIPDSVTSIGNSAFSGCGYLGTITIPSSVTFLGTNAFERCDNMHYVYVKNPNLSVPSNAFDIWPVLVYGIGNINYTLDNTAKTATVPSGTIGALSSFMFGGSTYTVIVPDVTAPTLTLTPNTTSPTNGKVTITATGVDNVGVASITNPDGTIVTGSSTKYDVSANATYTFIVKDTAGNTSSKTVIITNIDTVAIASVTKAEGSKLQVDVTSAQTLVTALTDSTYKTGLQVRLTSIQTYINNVTNATTKVATAENTKTQANVYLAQTAINLLPTGDTNRVALQTRLDVVKAYIAYQAQLTTATSAVAKAEDSKLQADVDSAKVLVNALTNETDKTNLTNRLNIVQTAIDKAKQDALSLTDATTKVATAETTKTQANVDLAQTAINLLPSGTDKTDLQTRLDKVKADLVSTDTKLEDATNSVIKAEGSKSQADVDSARILVNALPSGTDKTDLQARLDKVKSDLALEEAKKTVEKADTTKKPEDITIAKETVDDLEDGTDKTALQDALKAIQDAIDKAKQDALNAQLLTDAQAKVTTAELSKTTTDINTAQTAINKLPSGTDKTDLQNRLDTIKKAIADKQEAETKQAIIDNTTALVETAEKTKTDIDILRAQTAVNTLPVGTDRTDLQSMIDAIKQQKAKDNALAKAIKKATDKTKIAEAYVTNSKASEHIATAQAVIDNLPNGADKTALQERIDKLKTQIANTSNTTLISQAQTLVKQAELMHRNPYFTNAWAVVNQITACEAKTLLMNRLKVLGSDMEIK